MSRLYLWFCDVVRVFESRFNHPRDWEWPFDYLEPRSEFVCSFCDRITGGRCHD